MRLNFSHPGLLGSSINDLQNNRLTITNLSVGSTITEICKSVMFTSLPQNNQSLAQRRLLLGRPSFPISFEWLFGK
jgi:hypothetical protein